MTERSSAIATLLLFATLSSAASAQGFQGLTWGTSVSNIKRAFPSIKPASVSTDQLATCANPDGSKRHCSIAQSMCETMGKYCHAPLIAPVYRVGALSFRVVFNLSKEEQLSSVDLTLTEDLRDRALESAESTYANLFASLTNKYGAPVKSERFILNPYRPCSETAKCTYVNLAQWKTYDTVITLRASGSYERTTMRFLSGPLTPGLSISYSPLTDQSERSL